MCLSNRMYQRQTSIMSVMVGEVQRQINRVLSSEDEVKCWGSASIIGVDVPALGLDR